MGFLDTLKKMLPEETSEQFKLSGQIYFKANYEKLVKKNLGKTVTAELIPNSPGGISQYRISVQGKPVGYFPEWEEEFFQRVKLKQIIKVTLTIPDGAPDIITVYYYK